MLGGKGRSLIILAAFLISAGLSFHNHFLILCGAFFLFATLISMPAFESSMNVEELQVTREIDNKRVFRDDFMHVKVRIVNTGGTRFDFLDIFDNFPTEAFRLVAGENYISTRIDPKSTVVFSYILAPRVRGEFELGPLEITVRDRLGFSAVEKTVPNSFTEIVIYPPYEEIRALELLGAKRAMAMSFGVHQVKQKGTGTELRNLRKYVAGDQYRLIDWKASMRLQKLIVREFESERNVSTIILIDSSESMGGGAVDATKFEYAIKSGMLLAKLAMEQKDQVGVCTFSDRQHFRWLPPSQKRSHYYDIITFLGEISPKGAKEIFWSMEEFSRNFDKRSLVFLITDLEVAGVDIIAAVRKLKSYGHAVVVVAPFSPWFEIHELELSYIDKALAEAISEEMMLHVLQVRKDCQKLLVPVISVAPDDMFDVIVNQYQNAKQKGKAD
ncbi:MAG: DUF58 domain-containing protein [Candidatus Lokiarchaeota archaeon]|nr:DUF58 domain-containing protein [Candidatus Harpocratesius repetitus]